jgi:hypothetical protein
MTYGDVMNLKLYFFGLFVNSVSCLYIIQILFDAVYVPDHIVVTRMTIYLTCVAPERTITFCVWFFDNPIIC